MKYKNDIREIMEKSIHFINENFNQPLYLNDIAHQNYMSSSTYSRYFKATTQYKFSDYLQKIRIDHAKKDLINTDQSLIEIALNNGFSNSSVFSKVFKTMVHMSPSQYRKNHAKDPMFSQKNETTHLKISPVSAVPYRKNWISAINTGDAYLLLRADFQKQILFLQKELSIKYVRFWDILSTYFFPENLAHVTAHDFNHLDQITDFLVKHRLIPWINLTKYSDSFLSDISEYTAFYPEQSYMNRNLPSFFEKLFNHWIHRYGTQCVSSWIFEYWFDDLINVEKQLNDNIRLFSSIKSLLNHIIPGAKLGAWGKSIPGTSATMNTILSHWPKNLQPDFISLFCFPYQTNEKQRPEKLKKAQFTKMSLQLMENLLRKNQFNNIPIYITHWNITISPHNAINDSCALASILLDNIEDTFDYLHPCIYQYASDIIYLKNNRAPLVFGGIGLLTQNALPKPVFYALSFISKLHDYCICHGHGYIITTDNHGCFSLLLFNPCHLPESYYEQMEYEITTDYVLTELNQGNTLTFSIDLQVASSTYLQRVYRIIPGENDLLGHLKHFGNTSHIINEDLDYLSATIRPRMKVQELLASKGNLSLTQKLIPGEICYISLQASEAQI